MFFRISFYIRQVINIVISIKSIFYTWMLFQLLLNSKFGSDHSRHSILSYIIEKSIVMRIKIFLWEYPIRK